MSQDFAITKGAQSAGTSGQIQVADGAGGFLACNFKASDGGNRILGPGVTDDGSATLQLAGTVKLDLTGQGNGVHPLTIITDWGSPSPVLQFDAFGNIFSNSGFVVKPIGVGQVALFQGNGLYLCNSFPIHWSSSDTAAVGNDDVSVERSGAGVLKIGNAAGGFGGLLCGVSDSATNTVSTALTIDHETSGTPAAGFGVSQVFNLQSSTTAGRKAAAIQCVWQDATDATRKGAMYLGVYDEADTFFPGLLQIATESGVITQTQGGNVLDDGTSPANANIQGTLNIADGTPLSLTTAGEAPGDPATVVGWIQILVGGVTSYLPFYQ